MRKSKSSKQMRWLLQSPRFNTYQVTKPSGLKINFPYHGELTPEMIKRFNEYADSIKEPTPSHGQR